MGEGDHKSADSCRMGEVEGVGTVELVCWQTVEDGLLQGGEAETESLILWLVVLELLAGGWW